MRLWAAGSWSPRSAAGSASTGWRRRSRAATRELRLVKELFHGTEESRRPRLVVLDGEAGVGKSRLAWEFEKYVDGLTATDAVAPRALPVLRRRRGVLGAGRGGARPARARRGRRRRGRDRARSTPGSAEYVPDAQRAGVAAAPARRAPRAPDGAGRSPARTCSPRGRRSSSGSARTTNRGAGHRRRPARRRRAAGLPRPPARYGRAPIFVLALARPELLARRPTLGGRRASVVHLEPLDDAAMATLVDGLVVGLPGASRVGTGRTRRGHPAVSPSRRCAR